MKKINLFKFNLKLLKEKLLKQIENYSDYKNFYNFVKEIINDDEIVATSASNMVYATLSQFEDNKMANSQIMKFKSASVLLDSVDLFSKDNQRRYKYNFTFEIDGEYCSVFLEYQKEFKEEDLFNYIIEEALSDFKLKTENIYNDLIEAVCNIFKSKIEFAKQYVEDVIVSNSNIDNSKLLKNIAYIICEFKANDFLLRKKFF